MVNTGRNWEWILYILAGVVDNVRLEKEDFVDMMTLYSSSQSWSPHKQHHHHLGSCEKCRLLGPTPTWIRSSRDESRKFVI